MSVLLTVVCVLAAFAMLRTVVAGTRKQPCPIPQRAPLRRARGSRY